MDLPLVYLAFANAKEAHLGLLKRESREVYRALQPLEQGGKIAIRREESSAFGELYEDLLAHGENLVVFHYGGHANGDMLALEGGGGNAVGLARLLGQQRSLELVFLNGCATQGHVDLLLEAGVPAVIATSVPIGDQKAQEFSTAFYAALAEGRSVAQAFESGRGFVEGQYGAGGATPQFTRAVHWAGKTARSPVLEWGLFIRADGADELERWRLPQAQARWRVQLDDGRGPLRNLAGDPQPIEHRLPVRTVDAGRCRVCATASTGGADPAAACPVCGSTDVERGPACTMLAEQVLPFAIAEDDARRRVRAHLQGEAAIRLQRLYVPFWVFDLDTRTSFEGERGWNRALGQITPRFEWEPVRDAFDLPVPAYLVAAGEARQGQDSGAADWYWELGRAEPLQKSARDVASILFERPIESAFAVVAAALMAGVEAEMRLRVGGQEQRNLVRDTRYRTVSARTLLMPCWYATAEAAGRRIDVVLNGQTGALRPLQLPAAAEPAVGDALPARLSDEGSRMQTSERTYEPGAPRPGAGVAVSVFSGASVGLMVGVLLALSVSPVVGIFISALATGLAVLLGLNDQHFSNARALRIGVMGVTLLVGVGGGLYVRTHGLLSPSLAQQRDEYMALGFSKADALRLLEGRIIGAVPAWVPVAAVGGAHAAQPVSVAVPATASVGSYLFSSQAKMSDCAQLRLTRTQASTITAGELSDNLQSFDGWKQLVEALPSPAPDTDRKGLLLIALQAVCGEDGLAPSTPLRPTAAQCLAGDFAAVAALQPVTRRIDMDISVPWRTPALRLLGNFLCAQKSPDASTR